MRDVHEYKLRFDGAELGDLEIVTFVPPTPERWYCTHQETKYTWWVIVGPPPAAPGIEIVHYRAVDMTPNDNGVLVVSYERA